MAEVDLKKNKYIVTTKEICAILGLKERRIQQLAGENALVRVTHGKYDLPGSIHAYIDYLTVKDNEELDNQKETAIWTRRRREKVELELQIMKGELHRSEDVERVMNDMLGAFRARLLSLPSKIAPQVIGKTEIMVVKELLKEAVYEAMNELADYDPQVFYDHSKDNLVLGDELPEDEKDIFDVIEINERKHGRQKKKE